MDIYIEDIINKSSSTIYTTTHECVLLLMIIMMKGFEIYLLDVVEDIHSNNISICHNSKHCNLQNNLLTYS